MTSQRRIETAVNPIIATITDLASGEKVSIVDFGTFEVCDLKEK